MRIIRGILSISLFFILVTVQAQIATVPVSDTLENNSVDSMLQKRVFEFFECEERATFIGGDSALYKFMAANTVVSDSQMNGTILVQFVILPDGTVTDVALHPRSHQFSPNTHVAAIETIKKTSGHWNPARIKGVAVKQNFLLPVKYGSDQ